MLQLLKLILMIFTVRAAAPDTLVLAPGRFADVPASGQIRITVANGGVVRVTDKGSSLRVTAKKLGTSELRIGTTTVAVNVVSEPTAKLYHDLKSHLSMTRGLGISIENKLVWIRGRLLRWDDWEAISKIARGSGATYRFGAEMDDELRERVLKELRGRLRRAALPETSFDIRPTAAALTPTTPVELPKRLGEILGPYGFSIETSSSALSLEPMVRVRIVVAELIRTKTLQYGFTWPTSVRAQLLPSLTPPSDAVGLDISALEERGLGRILASPTLLCRSGKEASFIAGGEIPIKMVGRKNNAVIWKQYGVVLKIKPLADYAGRMSIGLETEVSALDRVGAVDGVPSVHTNRIESHFDLTHSRTIALSGLIKADQAESSGGLPGLSQLPILGALFSSKSFIEKKTELVVFVTPDIAKDDEP